MNSLRTILQNGQSRTDRLFLFPLLFYTALSISCVMRLDMDKVEFKSSV